MGAGKETAFADNHLRQKVTNQYGPRQARDVSTEFPESVKEG